MGFQFNPLQIGVEVNLPGLIRISLFWQEAKIYHNGKSAVPLPVGIGENDLIPVSRELGILLAMLSTFIANALQVEQVLNNR